MVAILPIIQIIISVLLIVVILLQTSVAGAGGAFGSGDMDGSYHTRRGFEKMIFNSTIALGILFAIVSFIIFLIG